MTRWQEYRNPVTLADWHSVERRIGTRSYLAGDLEVRWVLPRKKRVPEWLGQIVVVSVTGAVIHASSQLPVEVGARRGDRYGAGDTLVSIVHADPTDHPDMTAFAVEFVRAPRGAAHAPLRDPRQGTAVRPTARSRSASVDSGSGVAGTRRRHLDERHLQLAERVAQRPPVLAEAVLDLARARRPWRRWPAAPRRDRARADRGGWRPARRSRRRGWSRPGRPGPRGSGAGPRPSGRSSPRPGPAPRGSSESRSGAADHGRPCPRRSAAGGRWRRVRARRAPRPLVSTGSSVAPRHGGSGRVRGGVVAGPAGAGARYLAVRMVLVERSQPNGSGASPPPGHRCRVQRQRNVRPGRRLSRAGTGVETSI